jgi:hypothetical protein
VLVRRVRGLLVALLHIRGVVLRLVAVRARRDLAVEQVTQERERVRGAAEDDLRGHPFDQRLEVVLLEVLRRGLDLVLSLRKGAVAVLGGSTGVKRKGVVS